MIEIQHAGCHLRWQCTSFWHGFAHHPVHTIEYRMPAYPETLQNAMTSSRERVSAESRGLPHREVTDGLRGGGKGARNPSVSSSRILVAKGGFEHWRVDHGNFVVLHLNAQFAL